MASGLITQVYTSDDHVFPLVQNGLLLSCLFFIPDGLQVVAAQALRARKDIIAQTIIQYLSYGAIMMPLGYLFCVTLKGGVNGLVWAVIVASWVSGPLLAVRFIGLDRVTKAA
jgi:MATE family multidrug resistance protein